MKIIVSVLLLIVGGLSSQSFAAQFSNITISKVRFWSDSDVVYVTLSGASLNPAGCNGIGFWEIRAASEESKKRIYAMALVAKTSSSTVSVEVHDSVCSGSGINGYPTIWMMELE